MRQSEEETYKTTLDTRGFVYQLDNAPALFYEDIPFNQTVHDLTAAHDANRMRADGLRWIPKVNGQFKIPVVTIHTLGDMYVPFSMQQIYRKLADAQGSGDWLVQRAVRAHSRCDFTVREQVDAFDAMVKWAEMGIKPAGDDVATPATVAHPQYGCMFTKNEGGADDSPVTLGTRAAIAPMLAPCPAS